MATIPENKRRTSTSTARGGAGAGAGRTAQTTLEITDQPKDVFFKDEGGKSNYLTTGVRLPVETLRASGPLQLRCALHYESGKRVEERDQAILNLLGNEFEPITLSADEPETTIDFRLEKVSRRKDNQRFKVLIEPDYEAMGAAPRSPIAGAMTSAISVLSKRKTGQRMVSKRARPVTPGCHGCDGRAAAEETAASVEELRSQVATLQSGMDEAVAFARTQAETIAKLEALVTAALTGARYVRMTSASAPLATGMGAGGHGMRGAAAHRDSQAEAEAAMPSPMRGGSGGGGGGISGASGSGGRGPKGSGTDAGGPSVGAGAGAGAGAAAPGGSYGSLLAPDPVDRAVSTATTASEREEKILLSSLFPVGLDGASAAGGAGGAAGGGGAGDISMSAALGKWPSISAYLAPAISGSGGAAGLAGLLSSATATPGGSDADTVDESEGGEMRRPSLKRIRSKELELTFHFGTPSMPVRSRMPLAAVAGSAATHTTAGASASASASAAAAAPTTTTTTTTTSQVPSGKRTRTRPVPFEA